jgi:hypothetical protein
MGLSGVESGSDHITIFHSWIFLLPKKYRRMKNVLCLGGAIKTWRGCCTMIEKSIIIDALEKTGPAFD